MYIRWIRWRDYVADMESERRFSWKVPFLAMLAVLCTAGPLIWSRDFGLLLLSFIYGFGLGCLCLVLIVFGAFARESDSRLTLIVTGLAMATVLTILFTTGGPATDFVHNRIGFEVWYLTHHDVVDRSATRDDVISPWDDWGFAGMGNFSFLISDPDDTIGDSVERASVWVKRLKSDCEATQDGGVADVVRLRRGIYIVTTYNCGIENRRP